MNKIAIFYHVYQVGDWENMFNQQIDRMKASGLFDVAEFIHIGINGNHPIQEPSNKVRIVRNHDVEKVEFQTIESLYDFCKDNNDYNIIYMHTSGVSYSVNAETDVFYTNKTLWRKYQEYFAIDNWYLCNMLLREHDCVGTEWIDIATLGGKEYPFPHYAGNIWWAKSNYINQLDFQFFEINAKFGRFASEFFIGSGNPKYYNFYSSNRNLYYSPIYENEYRI